MCILSKQVKHLLLVSVLLCVLVSACGQASTPVTLTQTPTIGIVSLPTNRAARIAFASDRDGNSEIYIMNADGPEQTRITNTSAVIWEPT